MTRLIAGLIGLTALAAPSVASAYGPDCQATAELHYAIAESIELNADAAYEDALLECGTEPTMADALSFLREEGCEGPGTSWVEYAPGGWVAVCGDADGAELYRVAP